MQTNSYIKYPRNNQEAKKVIFSLDVLWLEIMQSPRGKERSKNFIRLMQSAKYMLKYSEDNIKNDAENIKLHQKFNTSLKDWAKKRRLPL